MPRIIQGEELTKGAYLQVLNETVWIPTANYGFAGEEENRTATAVRVLVTHSRAREVFLRLLMEAKTAGKLYALCGLYYADRGQFEKEVESFRHDTQEIPTVHCDVHGQDKVCDIVFCPQRDQERIVLKEGQTLRQWFKQNKGRSGYADISGGAYPEQLVNLTNDE